MGAKVTLVDSNGIVRLGLSSDYLCLTESLWVEVKKITNLLNGFVLIASK